MSEGGNQLGLSSNETGSFQMSKTSQKQGKGGCLPCHGTQAAQAWSKPAPRKHGWRKPVAGSRSIPRKTCLGFPWLRAEEPSPALHPASQPLRSEELPIGRDRLWDGQGLPSQKVCSYKGSRHQLLQAWDLPQGMPEDQAMGNNWESVPKLFCGTIPGTAQNGVKALLSSWVYLKALFKFL